MKGQLNKCQNRLQPQGLWYLSLLDGSFPSDDDLGSGLPLHRLQGVASRTDEKSDEVYLWMFILRNHHLIIDLDHRWPELGRMNLLKMPVSPPSIKTFKIMTLSPFKCLFSTLTYSLAAACIPC